MTDRTANFKLKLTAFNRRGWQTEYYANMRVLDSALSSIMTVANYVGVWVNQQAYAIGDKVTDGDNSIIYESLTAHTSSASPTTFAEERAAHTDRWTAWSLPARARGAWTAGEVYAMGDFVSDASSGRYAVCIVNHTASSNFTTDITAGYWDVLATITPVTLSSTAPQAVGTVASAGVGTLTSRDDHVHALAATLTTTEGVQGGGNVIANLTLKMDVNGLTTDTSPALTDPIAYYKVSLTAHRKLSLQNLWNTVSLLTAYTNLNVADEIPVRDGSGGGNGVRKITAQSFFNGITNLTALTAPAAADTLVTYDSAGSAAKKITFANLLKTTNLLTALTAPAAADLLPIYDSAGATGKAITFANILKLVNTLTEDTAPDAINDFLATYDASATAAKKASPLNLHKSAVLLQVLTASTSASLNFTGANNTLYRGYLCVLHRILPATNGADLLFRASTDQGATLRSGTEYDYARFGWASSTASAASGSGGSTSIVFMPGVDNSGAGGRGVSGFINVVLGAAAFDMQMNSQVGCVSTGVISGYNAYGENNQTNTNGFGLVYSSGNITSGTIYVYGIPK